MQRGKTNQEFKLFLWDCSCTNLHYVLHHWYPSWQLVQWSTFLPGRLRSLSRTRLTGKDHKTTIKILRSRRTRPIEYTVMITKRGYKLESWKEAPQTFVCRSKHQAQVVQKLDSAIHRIRITGNNCGIRWIALSNVWANGARFKGKIHEY